MVTLYIKYEYRNHPMGKAFDVFTRKYNTLILRQYLTMLWTYNRARFDPNVVICTIE
jgi:hypothetical protein